MYPPPHAGPASHRPPTQPQSLDTVILPDSERNQSPESLDSNPSNDHGHAEGSVFQADTEHLPSSRVRAVGTISPCPGLDHR